MPQLPDDKTPTIGDKIAIIVTVIVISMGILGAIVGLIRDGWDVMNKEAPALLVMLLLFGMLVYIGIASYMNKKGKNRVAAAMYGALVLMFLFVFIGQFSTCSTHLPEEVERPYRY